MAQVLMIVGSLRTNSFNGQVAKKIEEIIGARASVNYLDWADVPIYVQDNDYPAPAAVERVRSEVAQADGIIFLTPEYNLQIPGPLKNLTDWISRSLDPANPRGESAIGGKIVTVNSASANGGENVRPQLEQLLEFIRTHVVPSQAGIPINPEAWATGTLTISSEAEEALKAQVEAFLAELE